MDEKLNIKIPQGAALIIERLESCGKRADIVGGCVRDALLDRVADDFDITTSATPDEMLDIFSDFRVIETGLRHGTLTVISDGVPYEVTTYRIDGEYTDSRHPDSVTFTEDIADDLSRRDFTVNAMAYSERHGLTDLFSGREDISGRIIRAVGEPRLRFTEDALRILRALRFSSVLGFSIEEKTAEAAGECAHLLKNVSAERIYTEWRKLLGGSAAFDVISKFSDIIAVFLPELSGVSLPRRELFEEGAAEARQIALFAGLGDSASELFDAAMRRLKTDKRTRIQGSLVLESIGAPIGTMPDILRLLSSLGEECTRLLFSARKILGTVSLADALRLDEAVSGDYVYRISELAVGGEELSALGLRGEAIGRTLSELLLTVMDGAVENEREALLSYVKALNQ